MNKQIISLEITDELKEALRLKAFNEKVTISKLIRQILERELAAELKNVGSTNANR